MMLKSKRHVGKKRASSSRLLPNRRVILLALLAMALLLYYLYPQSYFEDYFDEKTTINETNLLYLQQLSEQFKDNEHWQLQQIRQQISLGYIERAKKLLQDYRKKNTAAQQQDEVKWLLYILARDDFYRLKMGNKQYLKMKDALVKQLKQLLPLTNTDVEYQRLIKDSAALGETEISHELYGAWLSAYPKQGVATYVDAAKTALNVSDYQASGRYYFAAQKLAATVDMQEKYFRLAVESLEKSGDAKLALAQAQQHVVTLVSNKTIDFFMAELALRAGQPAIAEQFIVKLLF